MSDFRQRVLNSFKNCTKKIIPYALTLIASSQRRSYAGMARSLEVEYDFFYNHIKDINENADQMLQLFITKVKKYQSQASKGLLIVDFTRLAKSKDAQTPMTTWDRDGRINKVNNGFSIGFCVWTNGTITIPLSHCFWVNKKDADQSYVSKKDLAMAAIKRIKSDLGIDEVLVDGEFATLTMMEFFAEENIHFTARIPANRCVVIGGTPKQQLKNHQNLRLRKNEKSRTAQGFYGGRLYDFTAVKHVTRGGKKKIVFIVSTKMRSSKDHVKTYALRWNIEKFFRTAKQSLGLEDCQAQKIDRVINHIHAVMIAFIALEETKFAKKKKSPELILRGLRSKNSDSLFFQYADLVETYATF